MKGSGEDGTASVSVSGGERLTNVGSHGEMQYHETPGHTLDIVENGRFQQATDSKVFLDYSARGKLR